MGQFYLRGIPQKHLQSEGEELGSEMVVVTLQTVGNLNLIFPLTPSSQNIHNTVPHEE